MIGRLLCWLLGHGPEVLLSRVTRGDGWACRYYCPRCRTVRDVAETYTLMDCE
jgi:hypothetical protein